jgi:hypothetical protein
MKKLNDYLIDSPVIVKYTKIANIVEIAYLIFENEIEYALI